MTDFREKLRARLHTQTENERWEILLRQKKLISEYSRITEELRRSDTKISRLLGPAPSKDVCPECHYRCGTAVALMPAADENRAGDSIMICPACKLVLPP